jgi:hypothetical protein
MDDMDGECGLATSAGLTDPDWGECDCRALLRR